MPDGWTDRVPPLHGDLTTLREVAASDVYALFTLFSDPAVTAYMAPPPPTLAKFAGFVEWSHQQRAHGHGSLENRAAIEPSAHPSANIDRSNPVSSRSLNHINPITSMGPDPKSQPQICAIGADGGQLQQLNEQDRPYAARMPALCGSLPRRRKI